MLTVKLLRSVLLRFSLSVYIYILYIYSNRPCASSSILSEMKSAGQSSEPFFAGGAFLDSDELLIDTIEYAGSCF